MADDSEARYPRRVNLRISEDTYAAYEELARLQGQTVSAVVREVLDTAAPEVSVIADSLRAMLGSIPTEGSDMYRKYIESIHARAGAEVVRANVWHREVEEAVKAKGAQSASTP
jgi:hypothetical protein